MKSDYKYHNEAVKAFQSLDEALRPFVKQEMVAVYKERWLEFVAKQVRWERDEPIWDTLALLHTMRWQWYDVFKMRRVRGPEELGKVSALLEWRHRIQGHSSEPVDKDAEAAISSILHLLKRVGAAAEVSEVEQLLLSFKPQPPLDAFSSPQKAQTEDQHSDLASQITEQLAEGQKKLGVMVSGTGTLPATEPPATEPPATEPPATEPPALPSTDKLRVEIEPPNEKSKRWMLQMYDGNAYIGSHETSTNEEQALKKEPEVYRAQVELREAFQKNSKLPIVVEYNGSSNEKRIKTKRGNAGVILGTIPERHWWTKNKP